MIIKEILVDTVVTMSDTRLMRDETQETKNIVVKSRTSCY